MADVHEVIVNLRDAVSDGRLGAFDGQTVDVYLNDQEDTGNNWFRMVIDGERWIVSLSKDWT